MIADELAGIAAPESDVTALVMLTLSHHWGLCLRGGCHLSSLFYGGIHAPVHCDQLFDFAGRHAPLHQQRRRQIPHVFRAKEREPGASTEVGTKCGEAGKPSL